MYKLQDLRCIQAAGCQRLQDSGFVDVAGWTLEVDLAFAFYAKSSPVVDNKTGHDGLLACSTL